MSNAPNKSIVIISGLAGSGKTLAFHALEDLGYYCIDNLPPVLLKFFTSNEVIAEIQSSHIALELDSRNSNTPQTLQSVFHAMSKICKTELLYLETAKETLLHRYRETRRHHPLISMGLANSLPEAIALDIETLSPIKNLATHVLDTTHMAPQELKRFILKNFAFKNKMTGLHLNFISFGFKHGVPSDLDTLFDVRCFKNPYYETELKDLSGLDHSVKSYVFADQDVNLFLDKVKDFITFMYPRYVNEGKHFFNIGIGCTGGKHRSVAIADALYTYFKSVLSFVTIEHRNIDT